MTYLTKDFQLVSESFCSEPEYDVKVVVFGKIVLPAKVPSDQEIGSFDNTAEVDSPIFSKSFCLKSKNSNNIVDFASFFPNFSAAHDESSFDSSAEIFFQNHDFFGSMTWNDIKKNKLY